MELKEIKNNVIKALEMFLKDTHKFEEKGDVQFFRENETNKINMFLHFDEEFKQDILVIKSLYTIPNDIEEATREICENYGLSYLMLIEQEDNT